jgi:hypothetical protein
MASNIEGLVEEFKGFQLMMQQMLDKMTGFEAWRATTNKSLGLLLVKTTDTVVRINTLEKAPIPPPPPPLPYLNQAPLSGASPSTLAESPSGHSAGGGVLGLISGTNPPLFTLPGMNHDPSHLTFDFDSGAASHTHCHGAVPKMDFPKFDGEQPRLSKEQCELYFEIYGMSAAMKPRFAALNFTRTIALLL